MKLKDLKALMSEGEKENDWYEIKFESSLDGRDVTIKLKSTRQMSALDCILALTEWLESWTKELWEQNRN